MTATIMNRLSNPNLGKQVLFSLLFGTIFIVVAYFWQDLFYRYIDDREYLKVDSPISVDNTFYKPGDVVAVSAGIEAEIDIQAVVLTELVLVKAETGDYAVVNNSQIVRNAPFKKADHHIVTTYLQLPSALEDGRYYWKGNACYEIKGYERCKSYVSQVFNVTQSGLSPSGMDLQDQIDELK